MAIQSSSARRTCSHATGTVHQAFCRIAVRRFDRFEPEIFAGPATSAKPRQKLGRLKASQRKFEQSLTLWRGHTGETSGVYERHWACPQRTWVTAVSSDSMLRRHSARKSVERPLSQ